MSLNYDDSLNLLLNIKGANHEKHINEMGYLHERNCPFVIYGATLTQDGNAFLAILGDLPTGVVGSGDSPSEAVADFNKAWNTKAKVPTKV